MTRPTTATPTYSACRRSQTTGRALLVMRDRADRAAARAPSPSGPGHRLRLGLLVLAGSPRLHPDQPVLGVDEVLVLRGPRPNRGGGAAASSSLTEHSK